MHFRVDRNSACRTIAVWWDLERQIFPWRIIIASDTLLLQSGCHDICRAKILLVYRKDLVWQLLYSWLDWFATFCLAWC